MNLLRWEFEMSIIRYEFIVGFECHWRLIHLVKRSPEASSDRYVLRACIVAENIAKPLPEILW